MTDRSQRAAVAERAATAGASLAEASFRGRLDVETKTNKNDLVTQADREAQDEVRRVVHEAFPDDAIVGEEGDGPKTIPEAGAAWIVDPIDGTANFVRGNRVWGTSVAAMVDGEPVAAANVFPAMGDAYVADGDVVTRNGEPVTVSGRADPETFAVAPTSWYTTDRREEYAAIYEGIVARFGDARRYGCAQAALSMVADGQLEGVVTNRGTHPWDAVAGVFMVRLAGGTVTDGAGDPWTPTCRGLVASNGRAHEAVLDVARAADAVRD